MHTGSLNRYDFILIQIYFSLQFWVGTGTRVIDPYLVKSGRFLPDPRLYSDLGPKIFKIILFDIKTSVVGPTTLVLISKQIIFFIFLAVFSRLQILKLQKGA